MDDGLGEWIKHIGNRRPVMSDARVDVLLVGGEIRYGARAGSQKWAETYDRDNGFVPSPITHYRLSLTGEAH